MIRYLKAFVGVTVPENRPCDFPHCFLHGGLYILGADQRRKYHEYVDSNRFDFGGRHIGGDIQRQGETASQRGNLKGTQGN